MVRYMDDYVIIYRDRDREYLKYALKVISDKLEKEYKLKINKKKTMILDSYHGFEFLGYNFKVINNRVIINIKSDNRRRSKNNIRKLNYLFGNNLISYKRYFSSMNNYNNSYKYNIKKI